MDRPAFGQMHKCSRAVVRVATEPRGQPMLGEAGRIVGKHQRMTIGCLVETEVNAFLLAQALQQVQIGLIVLDAQGATWIEPCHLIEAVGGCRQPIAFKQMGDQLWGAHVVVSAASRLPGQVLQGRHQHQSIMRQATADIHFECMMDQAVHALTSQAEAQERAAPDQAGSVQRGLRADQVDIETVHVVQGIQPGKAYDMQIHLAVGNRQGHWHLRVFAHRRALPP